MLTTDMTVFFEVGLKGADMRLQTRHNAFSFLECSLLTSEMLERTTERSCTRDFPQRLFFLTGAWREILLLKTEAKAMVTSEILSSPAKTMIRIQFLPAATRFWLSD